MTSSALLQDLREILRQLQSLPEPVLRAVLTQLPPNTLSWLWRSWAMDAHESQLPPLGDWWAWLFMGGRGSGKTRAGAEWVSGRVARGARRIALIAPTYHDAREVMLDGQSGLLNIGPAYDRPVYYAARRQLIWKSGAIGQVFSGLNYDRLRGPQFDTAWADEFAAWKYPEKALSNLRLGLRLTPEGDLKEDMPRLMITTTPRPIRILRDLMQMDGTVITHASMLDNAANLAPSFIHAVQQSYGGSHLGRQEIDGVFVDDPPGALWSRDMLARARQKGEAAKNMGIEDGLTILAVDPPVTSHESSDACGLIVARRVCGAEGHPDDVVIVTDASVQGLSPDKWARRAADIAELHRAAYIVVESNQGGEMVETIFRQIAPHIIVRRVHAAQSKTARAMPVALLYEQGRIAHAGNFPELEDELCRMGSLDESGGAGSSPDRADALIWAVHELLLRGVSSPRIRRL